MCESLKTIKSLQTFQLNADVSLRASSVTQLQMPFKMQLRLRYVLYVNDDFSRLVPIGYVDRNGRSVVYNCIQCRKLIRSTLFRTHLNERFSAKFRLASIQWLSYNSSVNEASI
jgi:hypothetical protein